MRMKGGKAQIQNTNIESKYRPDMHDNECASEGFSKWIVGVMNWKEVMLNCELHETYLTCMTMSMRGRGSPLVQRTLMDYWHKEGSGRKVGNT